MTPEYVAGLFDGEGYFTMRRLKASSGKIRTVREFRFQPYAQITIRERWLLEQCAEVVGAGAVGNGNHPKAGHSHTSVITWCGKALQVFLKRVGPHLIAKQRQKQVIERIVEIKVKTGNQPTSDSDYKEQCLLWERMRTLNQKGVGK